MKSNNKLGLKAGDIIESINKKSVIYLKNKYLKYCSGKTKEFRLNTVKEYILLGKKDCECKVLVKSGDNLHEMTLQYNINHPEPSIDQYNRLLSKNIIGYFNLCYFKKSDINDILTFIEQKKRVIFDLRGKLNSDISCLLKYFPSNGNHLIQGNSTPLIYATNKYITDRIDNKTICLEESETLVEFSDTINEHPIAILVNEETICFAEGFAKILRRYSEKAKIIGSKTAGASGVTTHFYLPGNIKIHLSGQGAKNNIIIPDLDCKRTIMGVKKNIDEVIEAAIEYLNQC